MMSVLTGEQSGWRNQCGKERIMQLYLLLTTLEETTGQHSELKCTEHNLMVGKLYNNKILKI